jgi:acetyl coenzyme A synthetase (ADP forming)-like protein
MDEGSLPAPVDAVLRDGSTVRIRPARDDDLTRIEDYLIGLSPASRQLRFFSPSVDVVDVATKAAHVEPGRHVTLLALVGGDEGEVVGGAQYFRTDGSQAEIGMSVADRLQGHGLGSILLGHLAAVAHEDGIDAFVAEVLPENHAMIGVFRESGFAPQIRAKAGTIEVTFPTTLTEDASQHFEDRDVRAAAEAIRVFMQPASVAVIGASRDPSSIGGRLARNLLTSGFTGVVYPVNPSASAVQGVSAYPSIADVPGPVDVAFIAVPARRVSEVARACGEHGVRGLVVISAGFAEIGGDGPVLQDELMEICRAFGMRVIGPNCMGIVNTDPAIGLNGTFATTAPLEGRVGFLSQSGAVGLAVMAQTARLGMGLSGFFSVGNKADLSGNDVLSYWAEDPRTDVCLLYLESFGNPIRFAHLARRIGPTKPIVAVKSGRSEAGRRAAASHTAAMLASDRTLDSLFRQSGVIRTDTLEEMLDVAALLTAQPAPTGNRVAIVTNAGGLAVQCADAAEARGLEIPAFTPETQEALRRILPAEAATANPVDMIASAERDDYAEVIRAVAGSGEVDAVIVIFIPPLESLVPGVAAGIAEAARSIQGEIPIVSAFMTPDGVPEVLRSEGVHVPTFAYPEQAAIALARAADYGRWRERPPGSLPTFTDLRPAEAAGVLSAALARGEAWLEPPDVERLLRCYGIRVPRSEIADDPASAGKAADRLQGRVVLKAIGPVHKTDVGAVRLGLRGPAEVEAQASAMAARLAEAGTEAGGFLVQEQVEEGVEMLVGVAADPRFGPVVACGAGGVAAELLRDIEVRVAPLTDLDAHDMVRALSTFPLLDGYRGATRTDVASLEDVILRVGRMAEAHPEIVEMDCNPVMVLTDRAVVVDARVRLEPTVRGATRRVAEG